MSPRVVRLVLARAGESWRLARGALLRIALEFFRGRLGDRDPELAQGPEKRDLRHAREFGRFIRRQLVDRTPSPLPRAEFPPGIAADGAKHVFGDIKGHGHGQRTIRPTSFADLLGLGGRVLTHDPTQEFALRESGRSDPPTLVE